LRYSIYSTNASPESDLEELKACYPECEFRVVDKFGREVFKEPRWAMLEQRGGGEPVRVVATGDTEKEVIDKATEIFKHQSRK
jgi:hypothetical protein